MKAISLKLPAAKLPAAAVIGLLAAIAALLWASVALAQPYPPASPTVVTASAAPAIIPAGGSTTITCSVKDNLNQPVAGAACSFSVLNQQGSGASVSPASAQTNAQGLAFSTLSLGSATSATVGVEANGVASQVVVSVAGASPAGALPAAGGPPSSDDGIPSWLLVIPMALGLMAAGGLFWMKVARRSQIS